MFSFKKKDSLEEVIDAPFFTLNGHSTPAKVVKVYDGDTIHVVFKYFGSYLKWKCRISHIDTPELRTKNEAEKERGYMVRDKVSELLLNKIVQIDCFEFDKYGRLLIEVTIPGTTKKLHEWLIENNYAHVYEGGTKQAW
jgi:micrococcal nuclease